MNRITITAFFLLLSAYGAAQVRIEGILMDGKGVVPYTRISITGTACGADSESDGHFYFSCPERKPTDPLTFHIESPDYLPHDETITQQRQFYKIRLDPVVKKNIVQKIYTGIKIPGIVKSQTGTEISGATITVDGEPGEFTSGRGGKFIITITKKKLGESFVLRCNAEGYSTDTEPYVASSEQILTVELEAKVSDGAASPVVNEATPIDSVLKQDQALIDKLFGTPCCAEDHRSHDFLYAILLRRLRDNYSPITFSSDRFSPVLSNNLDDIILAVARRVQISDCEEEILLLSQILGMVVTDNNMSAAFGSQKALIKMYHKIIDDQLNVLRINLGILLQEGFKKTYSIRSYKKTPLRHKGTARSNNLNRAKIFEFIMAASEEQSLKSNVYQAQVELIRTGKISLPLEKLRKTNGWQFTIDPDYYVMHYFKSRRKALCVLSKSSPLGCRILNTESKLFQDLKNKIRVDRLKISVALYMLIFVGSTEDIPQVSLGEIQNNMIDAGYTKFLSETLCGLRNMLEECNESRNYLWELDRRVTHKY